MADMEADEPYDFLNWHSNAPVVKDEKKEKVTTQDPDSFVVR